MANQLNKKQLLDLPVYTKSGQHLGKVVDFLLDSATHQIVQYTVRGSDLLATLLPHRELLVSEKQVISVSEEKMVVEDTVTPVLSAERKTVAAN